MKPLSEILFHTGEHREDYYNAISTPVIQSSNFAFTDLHDMRTKFADELNNHVYSRGNNPTVQILREKIAALEGAEDALVCASGAAAISNAVIANVAQGDHVICVRSPYSWTFALLQKLMPRFGVTTTFVDGKSMSDIENAIRPNTKVLYLESPNTLFFDLQDLEACAILAKKHNIITIIDNSCCSPIFQNPIELGINIVVHSGTKYLNGHSDVVVGTICGTKAMIKKIFELDYMTLGSIISPHDANLVIRGLRTLDLRLKKSDETASKLVDLLDKHPKVEKIWYPFHKDFPQLELAKKQMKGCGGLFSVQFKADSMENMEAFIHELKHFTMAVSWGGHESLIMPSIGFYGIEGRNNTPISWKVVRFYIGLEDSEWLWADLEQALFKL
jgi:cystathionine beta-lyase/cystathionine gamma-synthase